MEARRRYQSAADRRPPADPSSAKGKKAAGTIQASDALPLPIRHTNLLFSFLFMASLFFLMRRWREKVRNSTPLHVVGSLEILSIVSLVASLIYLLSFFGIAFVQSIVSTSDDEEEHQNNQQNQQQQQQRYSVPANPTPPPCPLLVDAPAGQKPKDIDLPAEDEDIIQSVVAGKIPSYSLESKLGDCTDGGLYVPHSENRFPGYDPEGKELNAETLRKYIFGGHVADYMESLADDDEERFKTLFQGYIDDGIEAEGLEQMYANAHKQIREDPFKKDPNEGERKGKEYWKKESLKHKTTKLSKEEKQKRVRARIAELKEAA